MLLYKILLLWKNRYSFRTLKFVCIQYYAFAALTPAFMKPAQMPIGEYKTPNCHYSTTSLTNTMMVCV